MLKNLKTASGHVHQQSNQKHQLNDLLKLYNFGATKNKLKLSRLVEAE